MYWVILRRGFDSLHPLHFLVSQGLTSVLRVMAAMLTDAASPIAVVACNDQGFVPALPQCGSRMKSPRGKVTVEASKPEQRSRAMSSGFAASGRVL